MANFINYNSFLIMAVLLEGLAIWYFFRKGINWGNGGRLIVVTALIVIGFLNIRPDDTSGLLEEDITAQIGQGKPVLIEFKSPNWMACVIAEPIVNGLETEFSDDLKVLRVDIFSPAGQKMTREYAARTTPTFVFLDGAGEEVYRQIGTIDADKIRTLVGQ